MTIEEVYRKFGLEGRDCLIRREAGWQDKVSFPSRIMRLLQDETRPLGKFDAVMPFDGKPLLLFYKNIDRVSLRRLHRDIWNFSAAPVVVIETGNVVEIYNGVSLDKKERLLDKITGERENKFNDFCYFSLVTGRTFVDYCEQFERKNRVDRFLLDNIEYAQRALCKMGMNKLAANAILGKIIFIRYLIDRNVRVNYPSRQNRLDNNKLCEIMRDKHKVWELFDYLQDSERGFNGDLFPLDREQILSMPDDAFELLVRMLKSEDLARGQPSFFDLYDFSILPIEFISNVYEKFIGKDNQARQGAYYTPTFLVDYIVEESVGEKLRANNDNYNCKILDPACGSGIFLVESLREIIEKYMAVTGGAKRNTKTFREALCKLAVDNIYGIDKDKSAILVAAFSVYLTLLDYQKPADIETFKFPKLLGCNLVCADAFDDADPQIRAMISHAHDKPFDVVLGNPPWRRSKKEMGASCTEFIRNRAVGIRGIHVAGAEIAQAFIVRSLDFAVASTECALIVTSEVLHNIKAEKFRADLLRQIQLNRVFELASVRGEIFNQSNDRAIAPACVLFFNPKSSADKIPQNVVEHVALKPSRFFTLFKAFMLTTRDIQYVKQSLLLKHDFLWKVLMYGSWLDFNFIRRLKENYDTVDKIIDKRGLLKGQGVTIGHNGTEDASHLVNQKFVDENAIKPYHVQPTGRWIWDMVTRRRNKRLFLAPVLLTKMGLNTRYHASSAILAEDAVYTHAVSAVKGEKQDMPLLRTIEGLFNSDLFAYYGIMCFSSPGIDRTRVHEQEMRSFPFCNMSICRAVGNLEQKIVEEQKKILSSFTGKKERCRIERQISDAFELSEIERALVDYANNIIVPYCLAAKATRQNQNISSENDLMLTEYAHVFVDRFARSMSIDGRRFVVEICFSRQIIGMRFKTVSEDSYTEPIVRKKEAEEAILRVITALSSDMITDRLFVHKDVRGFGSDYFYIFKPNEKRLWHAAVAYVDVDEFADAILRAGIARQ